MLYTAFCVKMQKLKQHSKGYEVTNALKHREATNILLKNAVVMLDFKNALS